MLNINNSKIEIEEVESANKLYLLFGMVYAILFVILEFVSIREFFVSSNTGEALGIFAVVQLPGIIALVGANVLINSYIHREKFNLYCCNLENGIDIEYIKENYYIKNINEEKIFFIDKNSENSYNSWKLMHKCD